MTATLSVLVIGLMVAVVHAGAPGVTYYASSTRGSDTNAGTSADAPFLTLSRLSKVAPFTGATIRLERGSVWVDDLLSVPGLVGGALADFGNGSLPRPAIWHSRSAVIDPHGELAAASVCVRLGDPRDVVVSNLHMAGCYIGVSLEFDPTAATPASNVTLTNCSFADIRTPYGAVQPSLASWGTAIRVAHAADGVLLSRTRLRGRGQDTDRPPAEPGGASAAVSQLTISHTIGIRLDTFFQTVGGASVNGLVLQSNTVARCGGNCVGMEAADMHMLSSVFLRDTPEDLFLYGTTDVIIGTVSGNNSIEDTDFNSRGEYEAGPDGCAVDFETSASGFTLSGNTFYRSWGAGVMVFGHATTSHGLLFTDNSFVYAGCIQPRGDRAGIALMCPGGSKPSGTVSNNRFLTCPSAPAIFANPSVPGCAANVTLTNNQIDGTLQVVDQPQLSFNPPSPDSTNPTPTIPVIVFCTTPNATLRYTTDGSRPSATSPVFPTNGIPLVWPGPNVAVNVRGFRAGFMPSVTNGVIVERRRYVSRVGTAMRGSFDILAPAPAPAHGVAVGGWAVDPALSGGGVPPVTILVSAGGKLLASIVANEPRPDLVKAKVAPNPEHGFTGALNASILATLKGKHVVTLSVIDTRNAAPGLAADWATPRCLCDGAPCAC